VPSYLSPGVYVEEVPAGSRPIEGVGTAVAAFVGFAEKGPFNEPTLVTNWTQFTSNFGGFVDGGYLAPSVYGYFANGGGSAYVVRVGEDGTAARSNGKAGNTRDASPAPRQGSIGGGLRVVEAGTGDGKGDLTVEVQPATSPAEGEQPPPDDAFTLVVRRGSKTEETFPNVTVRGGKNNVVTAVAQASKLIRVEEAGTGPVAKPSPGSVTLTPAPAPTPARITTDDYVGDVAERTGFSGLEAVDEVTMVLVPDLMSAYNAGAIELDGVQAVQTAMITHCELMGDRMAVLDPPPGLNPQQVKEWRTEKANYDSKFAALYYPWIEVFDPLTGKKATMPPSGHMAGIWARNDDTRGVHKAPANEVVRGAVGLATQLTKGEHDQLNPVGINCIRAFPGRGIRVWGARTLSSDAEWRYLNVRRLFNFLEESILNGTQWVVFEPNDEPTWARITRTVGDFLTLQWRQGALFGLTPDEAFYIKCDRETNPPEVIDAGQVVCEIGVAPVKPAEFVIFRLAQFSGGSSLVSE
jgi:phage tail sheath protein FI